MQLVNKQILIPVSQYIAKPYSIKK